MPRLTALIYFGVKMKINFKIISLFLILFFISMTFAYAANEDMQVSANADIKNNRALQMCVRVVARMMHGSLPDRCFGAIRFHHTDEMPDWATSRGYIADVDGLLFYL